MHILALETSLRIASVATLCTKGSEIELLHSQELSPSERTAQTLFPALQKILQQSDWKPADLDLVCVATGPGSFTGLRIGTTTAKTLAYAIGAKLVGVSTLATIAASVETETRLWTLLDAQRQELFAACFEQGWKTPTASQPETQILSIDDWLERLDEGDLVAGPPLAKLSNRLPTGVEAIDPEAWVPRAEMVGRLGFAAYQQGQTADPIQLVPNYYRKSAAEEKAEKTTTL